MNPLRNLLRQLVVTRHLRKHSNSFHLRGISLSVPDTIPLGIRYQLCIGSYERTELKLVERHLPRHQPVVELGGCLGVVSAYVRSLLEPSVPLITLEANPNLIEICKANIERQRRGAKSEVVSGALSYNAGRASFHVSDNTHVSRLADDESAANIEIPAYTLSGLIAKLGNVSDYSLICDIEGAEMDLFEHEPQTLGRCSFAMVETHPHIFEGRGRRIDDFLDLATQAGFVVAEQEGNVYLFRRL